MPPGQEPVDLSARRPKNGERLAFDGLEWEVTGQSTYKNDEGYQVREWCCETPDTEAYLLLEEQEKGEARWFFTRWIDPGTVALRDGEALGGWLRARPWGGRAGALPEPPTVLVHAGRNYIYAETTEGVHAEDGETTRKTTWDYWDESRDRNIAVELWEDGAFDFYNGRTIRASEALILPPRPGAFAALGNLSDNPYALAGVAWFVVYGLLFLFGLPFDKGSTMAAAVVLFAVYLLVASRLYNLEGVGGLGLFLLLMPAAGLAVLFFRFHPLTSLWGALGLVGGPAVMAWLTRRYGRAERRLDAQVLACLTALLPAGTVGLYHYFNFAPGPRTVGQLLLALGPALLGGAAGHFLAGRIVDRGEAP